MADFIVVADSRWIITTLCADIHGHQRLNPANFSDSLTCLSEISTHLAYVMERHQIQNRNQSWFPDDVP